MSELLPCPFCGAPVAFMPYKRDGLKIECKPCTISYQQRTMRFDLDWLEEKMAAHWNRRATPADHISKLRDALVLMMDVGFQHLPANERARRYDIADAAIESQRSGDGS